MLRATYPHLPSLFHSEQKLDMSQGLSPSRTALLAVLGPGGRAWDISPPHTLVLHIEVTRLGSHRGTEALDASPWVPLNFLTLRWQGLGGGGGVLAGKVWKLTCR